MPQIKSPQVQHKKINDPKSGKKKKKKDLYQWVCWLVVHKCVEVGKKNVERNKNEGVKGYKQRLQETNTS